MSGFAAPRPKAEMREANPLRPQARLPLARLPLDCPIPAACIALNIFQSLIQNYLK